MISDYLPGLINNKTKMSKENLLNRINTPESDIDKYWVVVAKDRLKQLKAGKVTAVSSEEVFKKIAARRLG